MNSSNYRSRVVLDEADNASTRFSALAEMFDCSTQRHFLDHGLREGWCCLEVGAGGGSIAAWLSRRVGAKGWVVATDIDTRFIESLQLPNLQVLRHDVTRDPLPARAFDLVHTRMVLIHLPDRDEVLKRLTAALKPGGWLVAEEFDGLSLPADPEVSPGEVVLKTNQAMRRLSEDCHVNQRYGRLLVGRFRALGLTETGAEGRIFMVQARSASARLLRASYELRRSSMIAAGYVTEREFDNDLARMDDPQFMIPSPILWSAWGRLPTEA
jgi:2-polyprenyl-3-methyl-5-hydroxy-6-metoxy-1,4-benzoquinol methylase